MPQSFRSAIALAAVIAAALLASPAHAQVADVNGGGLFTLPNFEGDTREEDSHYNTMHQYPFAPWDDYRQLLYSYVSQARSQGQNLFPPPPYSTYDYIDADMTAGPGGPVPSAVGTAATLVNGSSGVSVNINGGNISGIGSYGVATGSDRPIETVTGQVITPGQHLGGNAVPGLAP